MIYAISDIHGCIEELQKQMEQVELSGDNRIIFLGDYIDYGDSSYQVLKYIWDLQKEYGEEKVVVLKGNHEQIFVHAGVDEEAGEYWMWGTSDSILLGKFPATKGKFYKTIIAGHVGTGTRDLADDRNYHDVFYDGESHYYIDGSVYKGGKLLLLAYDEENGKYYQVENDKMIPVRPFDKYQLGNCETR